MIKYTGFRNILTASLLLFATAFVVTANADTEEHFSVPFPTSPKTYCSASGNQGDKCILRNPLLIFYFHYVRVGTGNNWFPNGITVNSPTGPTYDPDLHGSIPLPPADATVSSVLFLGCHQPGCALWYFNYTAGAASIYRIESRAPGGTWTFRTLTTNTTYLPHLSGNNLEHRVRGENSIDVGGWKIILTTGQCAGGGGPLF